MGCFVAGAVFVNLFVVQLAGVVWASTTCMMIWTPVVVYGVFGIWMARHNGYEYLFRSHQSGGDAESPAHQN
jgi:UPF0716 family protein affecting phage T7 exclusion